MKPLAAAGEAGATDSKPPAKAGAAGAPRAVSAQESAKGAPAGGSGDSLAKVSMKKLFGRPNIKKDGKPGKVRGARRMQAYVGVLGLGSGFRFT